MLDKAVIDETKASILKNASIGRNGLIVTGSKWLNEHWSSVLLWRLHLEQSLSGVESWSHDGLGYWMMVKLDGPTLTQIDLEDCENHWVEIHERDDGIMETSYWNDAEHDERVKELNDLCYSED